MNRDANHHKAPWHDEHPLYRCCSSHCGSWNPSGVWFDSVRKQPQYHTAKSTTPELRPHAWCGPQPAVTAPAADYETFPQVWSETNWHQYPNRTPEWQFPNPKRSRRFPKADPKNYP